MRTFRLSCVSILLAAIPAVAEEDPLSSLAWISGTWAGTGGNVEQLEYWSPPGGGILLGLHRDIFEGGRSFFEYLRIERRGDEIVYVAMPRGSKTTDFTMTEQGDRRAVFENPGHDFPTKIAYERDGDTLTATISGLANGEMRSKSWSWKRLTSD